MNGLDLFSGIGGITLGLSQWVTPVAYCEIEPYAQAVLIQRMAEGKLPKAPIWDDITTLGGCELPDIDIIYGGFPCQDISVAGRGEGLGGKRSGLFFEVCRLVEEIKPRFIFLENVPAIRTRGLREVIRTLTDLGYDCRWTSLSAAEVGAPHIRKRWFLLAYSDSELSRNKWQKNVPTNRQMGKRQAKSNHISNSQMGWETEPNVGRVANGVPFRVDRLKALGNGVVPRQVEAAFRRLLGERDNSKA